MEDLTALLRAGEVGSEDGEGREQWVAMLGLWVYKCQDLVRSVEEEAGILQHMERVKREGPVARRPEGASGSGPAQGAPRQPAKPLVITREMLRVRTHPLFTLTPTSCLALHPLHSLPIY